MTKVRRRKYALSRRIGQSLWGEDKDPARTKNYPPGHVGARAKRTFSIYGKQLIAKQKFKTYYGIQERQFRNMYEKANKKKGDTDANFIAALESRLDILLYRAKFAPTVACARQFVSHKHVLVNGKQVNIPSYSLKSGDVVEIRQRFHSNPILLSGLSSNARNVPDYVSVEDGKLRATFVKAPTNAEDVPYAVNMEIALVLSFYSI